MCHLDRPAIPSAFAVPSLRVLSYSTPLEIVHSSHMQFMFFGTGHPSASGSLHQMCPAHLVFDFTAFIVQLTSDSQSPANPPAFAVPSLRVLSYSTPPEFAQSPLLLATCLASSSYGIRIPLESRIVRSSILQVFFILRTFNRMI